MPAIGVTIAASRATRALNSDDPIEAEGVRRARARAEAADLCLWVRGPGDPPDGVAAAFAKADDLTVFTKADLGAVPPAHASAISVSTTTGEGLQALHDWLSARLQADLSGADFPAVTRERHRLRLVEALSAVEAGRRTLDIAPEMAGDDLRRAADALARVTGAIGVEDVLGEVFSSFCIGK